MIKLICGDCLEKLKDIPDGSVDSIVTDPPAGISFMSKKWDDDKGGRNHWIEWMCEIATECKRVLKPGGHAFVWAIPRTSHWTATAWENAGFEIRDVVAHVFGSGFPKSHNIGKSVDKLQGNEREDLGENENQRLNKPEADVYEAGIRGKEARLTKGTSEWEGWGSALKPAREDWLLMRKPLEKGLSIAENCLKWGVGGINIDESRVGTETIRRDNYKSTGKQGSISLPGEASHAGEEYTTTYGEGRFPANLIHDNSEEVRECFPDSKGFAGGGTKGAGYRTEYVGGENKNKELPAQTFNDSGNASRFFKSIPEEPKGRFPANLIHDNSEEVRECFPDSKSTLDKSETNRGASKSLFTGDCIDRVQRGDSGNASRYFKSIIYTAKASKAERNKGCEGLEEKAKGQVGSGFDNTLKGPTNALRKDNPTLSKNNHPTVKPVALMEYLINMVTPKAGTILDPFMGSGSTGVAAKQCGFSFIGIELDPEYFKIAEKRINERLCGARERVWKIEPPIQ